jgi:type II secretory pathway pseudopilin PulG
MKNRNLKTFTLVELLVVISVIMVLATFVSISLISTKKRARDQKRISDANNIAASLDAYAIDHQRLFPAGGCAAPAAVGVDSYCVKSTGEMLLDLSNYLNPIPTDPLGGTGYGYYYIVSNDRQKAAIVVAKAEMDQSLCNIPAIGGQTDPSVPKIVQEYLGSAVSNGKACYYVTR